MRRGVLLALASAVVMVLLWVMNCSGPQPVVTAVRLTEPTSVDAPYRVEVELLNRWRGHGEVAVTVRLRDPGSGRRVVEERHVSLEGNERVVLVVELLAPPGRYEPEVTVQCPLP
jgi:hypothetical protein